MRKKEVEERQPTEPGEIGRPPEFVPVSVTIPKGLLGEINRKSKELGFSRSQFIRQAAEILIQIPKEDFDKLRWVAEHKGVSVWKLIQQAVASFIKTGVEVSVKIEQFGRESNKGKVRRK